MRSTTESRMGVAGSQAERAALRGLIANARDGASAALVVRGPRRRQDRAARRPSCDRGRLPGRSGLGRRVGDGAGVRRPPSALRALPGAAGPAAGAPASERCAPPSGSRSAIPPDRFLVGLAVLSLLADVAETQPLVCLLDDIHWLDQASAQVLGFVARRLAAESVVMVFADPRALGRPPPGRAARVEPAAAARRRCPRAARSDAPGATRRDRPRSDRRRGPWQPARLARDAAGMDAGSAGRRVRAAGSGSRCRPDRGELPEAAQPAA